jgi:glyoxylase-like metal-dependent hydrolase (beta-lactamase superfamily II)
MRVVPMHLGSILRDKSSFTYLRNQGVKVEIPIIAWLVETDEMRIIVDTGTNAPESTAEYHKPLSRSKEQELPFVLSTLGVDPTAITLVILTHLHWDHCYNTELFPHAEFVVQREELRYAIAPLPLHTHAYDLAPIRNTTYTVVNGDKQLAKGISVLVTPGHTPGFQSVLIENKGRKVLIASDTIPLFENWSEKSPIPSGIFNNLDDYYSTFEKLRALSPDLVLPGHDINVFRQKEYVV